MPLARIDLAQGKSPEYRRTIGDVVYEAVVRNSKRQRAIGFRSSRSIPPAASSRIQAISE